VSADLPAPTPTSIAWVVRGHDDERETSTEPLRRELNRADVLWGLLGDDGTVVVYAERDWLEELIESRRWTGLIIERRAS
jgi:hypothetical protein